MRNHTVILEQDKGDWKGHKQGVYGLQVVHASMRGFKWLIGVLNILQF